MHCTVGGSSQRRWIEASSFPVRLAGPVPVSSGNLPGGLVVSSQAAQPYGLVAQALQKVIDQLRPIAERGEAEVYEKYNAW